MSKIIDSLKKRIGRIIKTMQDFFISIYPTYFPLAVLCMLTAIEKSGWFAWGLYICGLLFIIGGFIAMGKAWNELKARQDEEQKQRKENKESSDTLINEIRGLRQDFKNGGNINERNYKPQTPDSNAKK